MFTHVIACDGLKPPIIQVATSGDEAKICSSPKKTVKAAPGENGRLFSKCGEGDFITYPFKMYHPLNLHLNKDVAALNEKWVETR